MPRKKTHAARMKRLAEEMERPVMESIDPEDMDWGDETAARKEDVDSGEDDGPLDMPRARLRGMDDDLQLGSYAGERISRKQMRRGYQSDGDDEGSVDSADAQARAALEAQMEGAWESSSDDDADTEDENVDQNGASMTHGPSVEDPIAQLEHEERSALRSLSRSAQVDAQRGRAVRGQIQRWERLLECRIRVQLPLAASNRLPRGHALLAFETRVAERDAGSAAQLHRARERVRDASYGIISDLMEVHRRVGQRLPRLKASLASRDHRRGFSGGECVLPSSYQEGGDAIDESGDESEDDDSRPRKRRRLLLESTSRAMDAHWKTFLPAAEAMVDETHTRTLRASGLRQRQQLRAMSQPVSQQVAAVLEDEPRRRRRTHPRMGHVRPLGQRQREDGGVQADDASASVSGGRDVDVDDPRAWDQDAWDDTEFYQSLLKELLATHAPAVPAAEAGPQQEGFMAAVRAKRPLQRKDVDRRASKGRKLRYTIQPKIVNFVAPKPLLAPTMDVDTLRRSLFTG